MSFSIIVACTPSGGIGKKGVIPWHLPPDLKHFCEITTAAAPGKKNAVIMGRKTWESLPIKPLPRRQNIVVSRTLSEPLHPELWICEDLVSALKKSFSASDQIDKVFVIGGEQLYFDALIDPQCEHVYMTSIEQDAPCDRFFPLRDLHDSFELITSEPKQLYQDIGYTYEVYSRSYY